MTKKYMIKNSCVENVRPTQSYKSEKEINLDNKTKSVLTFDEFMKIHYSNDEYTHTSYTGGKWFISDDELDLFYTLYADHIKKTGIPMHITEKHQPKFGPIIGDFDFRYIENIKSPITSKIIDQIVKHITSILQESFSELEDFTCMVSKRAEIYYDEKSKKYKDGIHFIFPYIVTTYDYQFALRDRYMQVMADDIKDIPFYINETRKDVYLDDIYDDSVIERNNWFLYMSTKPNTLPYIIYKVYNSSLSLKCINKMNLVDIVKLMSIRNKYKINTTRESYDIIMFDYYTNFTEDDNNSIDKNIHNNTNNEKIVSRLLNILSKTRVDSYKEWIKIGFIMHNEAAINNTIDYFNLWKEWSKQSNKYVDGCCEKYWNLMKTRKNCLGMGSLYRYAKLDNPDEYAKIIKKSNKYVFQETETIFTVLNNGQWQTAQYYCNLYKNDVLYSNDVFYQWDNQTDLWKRCKSNDFPSKVSSFVNNIINDYFNALPKNATKPNLSKLLSKYTNHTFISGVSKYCTTLLNNDLFEELADNQRHTINFKNGTFDLKLGIFRKRLKTDYITKCLPFDYTEQTDTEISNEIENILLQISNDDKKLLEFNLGWLGYSLTGETKEQRFLMIVGYSAQNGKSTMAKMFMNSLPIYSEKIDRQTFSVGFSKTHKQFSMVKKPVRFVFIDELDRSKIDIEKLKDFVDGDKIGGNEVLYGTTETIELHCKLFCTSNKDPIFDCDQGVLRRGLLEILTNKFVEAPDYDKSKKGLYIRDKNLENKFKYNDIYKLAFIKLLIPYAKKYYDMGLDMTNVPDLKNGFKNLCDDNDQMKMFIEEYFDVTSSDEDRIHRDNFVQIYNNHYNTKHRWNYLMSDVKRILVYDRQKRVNGVQGVIIGIKFKDKYNDL